MLDNLIFFNHFGNGDIFESREFVRDFMQIFKAKKYTYLHGKSERLLMDMVGLESKDDFPEFIQPNVKWKLDKYDLYINTWIGRDSKYVLPGIGCTVEMLHSMYSEILREVAWSGNISQTVIPLQLSGQSPIEYLTSFDYSWYETKMIFAYMKGKNQKKVFISNGNVHSNQAENFDMSELIIKLADKFKDYLFFITQNFDNDKNNIIDANSLIPSELDSNLVELSYLSTFCDVLIGRNSGPHVFSWTKENCFSDKINITFTKNIHCSHFVHHEPIMMKKYWSNKTDTEELFNYVSDLI